MVAAVFRGPMTPPANQATPLRLDFPLWAANPVCRLLRDGKEQITQTGSSVTIDCGAREDVLACDAEGLEPFDVSVGALCREKALPAVRGTVLRVPAAQGTGRLQVLELDDKGPRVLATRAWDFARPSAVSVAPSSHRYLRFFRAGAAPVTYAAQELILASPTWVPEEPRAGGEFVVWPRPSAVQPSSFRLTRLGGVSVLLVRRNQTGVSALLPGMYDLEPLYAGGITGAALRAAVEAGATTDIVFRPEDVGAVTVSVGERACGLGVGLRLGRLDLADSLAISAEVGAWPPSSECQWSLAGLRPGLYEATARVGEMRVGRTQFQVHTQTTSSAAIADASVTVFGTVTKNDKPLANEVVRFRAPDTSSADGVETRTDHEGRYDVTLGEPGRYRVTLGKPAWPLERRVELVEGSNRLDWSFAGGAIAVRLNGWDRSTRTTISAVGPTPQNLTLSEGDKAEAQLSGLAFGTYEVRAAQRNGAVSVQPKKVTISASSELARVELDLRENVATLAVRDGAGLPVSTAIVRMGTAAPLASSQPGFYSLTGVPPGAMLYVTAPGLVPSCRFAAMSNIEVTLAKGQPAVIQFPFAVPQPAGYLVGVPGSECPVPMALFQSAAVPSDSTRPRFAIDQFPSSSLSWKWPGLQERPLLPIVLSDGVFVIKNPEK